MNEIPDLAPDETLESWREALREGRAGEALNLYLAGEAYDAPTHEALRALAELRGFLRAKRYVRALTEVRRVEEPPPLLEWSVLEAQLTLLSEANEALERRKPEGALEKLGSVTLPLLEAEADTQRGTAYIFQNETDKAEACFIRALERDPKHYRAITNRGNLALEAGRTEEAIEAYGRALAIDDEFVNAHHNLGVAYRRLGKIDKSVQSIRKAQKASRRQDSETARESLSKFGGGLSKRFLRYALYAGAALIVYFVLRSQGIL